MAKPVPSDATIPSTPIPTDCPPGTVGRCWSKFPPWIKRFYNPRVGVKDEDGTPVQPEEEVYLELSQMPKELKPRIDWVLPFDFEDKTWIDNLTAKPAVSGPDDVEEPSYLEQISMHFRTFFVNPHPLYVGGLFLLWNSKDPLTRTAPVLSLEKADSISMRGTASAFEIYRTYACFTFFFERHFMIRKNEQWAKRTLEIYKRRGERLKQLLSAYEKRCFFVEGLKEIRYKCSRGLAKPMDFYSEELAERYALVSHRFAVSLIRIQELLLMEMIQIDASKAAESGFLTPEDVPPAEDVSPVTKAQIAEDQVGLCALCNNTVENDKYDLEHIAKTVASERFERRWGLSPSYLFQTLIYIARANLSPTEAAAEKKEEQKKES